MDGLNSKICCEKEKKKKEDPARAEIYCSIESSASKLTPRVFTTLENGMDASPTERQSAETVSLLGDGPHHSGANSIALGIVQRTTKPFPTSWDLGPRQHLSEEKLGVNP